MGESLVTAANVVPTAEYKTTNKPGQTKSRATQANGRKSSQRNRGSFVVRFPVGTTNERHFSLSSDDIEVSFQKAETYWLVAFCSAGEAGDLRGIVNLN